MSNKEKVLGIIFIIWFLASIFAMGYLSKINTNYCIMAFGQFFLVLGLIFFVKGKSGIPLVLIGLACIIFPYLIMNPEINGVVIDWESVIVLLLISVFVVVGMEFAVRTIIKYKRIKRACTEEVDATIVKYRAELSGDKVTHCPIYKFEFDGKKYVVESNLGGKIGSKSVGTVVKLKINPDNPQEFLDKGALIATFVLGIMFLIPGIISLILFLQNASFVK